MTASARARAAARSTAARGSPDTGTSATCTAKPAAISSPRSRTRASAAAGAGWAGRSKSTVVLGAAPGAAAHALVTAGEAMDASAPASAAATRIRGVRRTRARPSRMSRPGNAGGIPARRPAWVQSPRPLGRGHLSAEGFGCERARGRLLEVAIIPFDGPRLATRPIIFQPTQQKRGIACVRRARKSGPLRQQRPPRQRAAPPVTGRVRQRRQVELGGAGQDRADPTSFGVRQHPIQVAGRQPGCPASPALGEVSRRLRLQSQPRRDAVSVPHGSMSRRRALLRGAQPGPALASSPPSFLPAEAGTPASRSRRTTSLRGTLTIRCCPARTDTSPSATGPVTDTRPFVMSMSSRSPAASQAAVNTVPRTVIGMGGVDQPARPRTRSDAHLGGPLLDGEPRPGGIDPPESPAGPRQQVHLRPLRKPDAGARRRLRQHVAAVADRPAFDLEAEGLRLVPPGAAREPRDHQGSGPRHRSHAHERRRHPRGRRRRASCRRDVTACSPACCWAGVIGALASRAQAATTSSVSSARPASVVMVPPPALEERRQIAIAGDPRRNPLPAARDRPLDGRQRHLHRGRDLFQRHALEIAQREHQPVPGSQAVEHAVEPLQHLTRLSVDRRRRDVRQSPESASRTNRRTRWRRSSHLTMRMANDTTKLRSALGSFRVWTRANSR